MSDLVIDADLMRAAGFSEHHVSRNSRLILEQIRAGGHRLVHTPSLKREHDKHQSLFAKQWRGSMVSRKQWVPITPPENAALRQHLVRAQNSESKKDEIAVLKDAHLLEAAAASDLRIISNDTTAKALFRKGCPLPVPFGRILWADATLLPDDTQSWIEQGYPDRPDWRICPAKRTSKTQSTRRHQRS
jgi:hypothetical protein